MIGLLQSERNGYCSVRSSVRQPSEKRTKDADEEWTECKRRTQSILRLFELGVSDADAANVLRLILDRLALLVR